MAINPIVTALPDYVEQHKSEIISKAVLGGDSAKIFSLATGVVGPTTINELTTDVVIQNGEECGFSAEGEQKLSQRTITPKALKVNMEYCEKKLLKKYLEHEVKMAATNTEMPFEEKFVNDVVAGVQAGIEKMIYQGDGDNDNECDGLLKILKAESETQKINKAAGTDAYAAIKEVYMALPAVALKPDTVILVSNSLYRSYIQSLVSANLYHYDPANGADGYMLPGTSVKVMAKAGLDGADAEYIIAGRLSNLYYGTDMLSDSETVDFWFSKDDRTFKLDIEWTSGTQVAWPDEVVLGSIAKA